jgi:uncharacterized protein with GYD domain
MYLAAPERNELDFRHWSYDPRTKKRTERIFKSRLVRTEDGREVKVPDRQFFIQLVRFTPGKGPKDYTEFYKEIDEKLARGGKKTRHELDIHEIATFATFGRYDMIVLCDAPNMATYNKFLASYINPGSGKSFGTTETQIVACAIIH